MLKITDRNITYQNGKVLTHSDVQCGSANRQTLFSGQDNACIKLPFSGHIAKKFRKATILQLNIEAIVIALNLLVLPHPYLYAGDFNYRHADRGYDDNSPDDECLAGWTSINCLALLYNASFYSGRWNTGTSPDVAFASVGPNSCLPDRRVIEKFPRSQH